MKETSLEHQTLGQWVVRPIDPGSQRIILKIVGFKGPIVFALQQKMVYWTLLPIFACHFLTMFDYATLWDYAWWLCVFCYNSRSLSCWFKFSNFITTYLGIFMWIKIIIKQTFFYHHKSAGIIKYFDVNLRSH